MALFGFFNSRKDRVERERRVLVKDPSRRPQTASGRKEGKSNRPTRPSTAHGHHDEPSESLYPPITVPVFASAVDLSQHSKASWRPDQNLKSKAPRPRFNPSIRFFSRLPQEVYDGIILQLEQIQLQSNEGDPRNFLNDLCSLSLTSRVWNRAAIAQLYPKIHLSTTPDHSNLPCFKIQGTSRLKLLRRTLRASPALALDVRELHLSAIHNLYLSASIDREAILNLVASLVLACPSLERLIGFHVPFTQSFDRLSQALSSRQHLKERVWVLAEPDVEEHDEEEVEDMYYLASNDPTERFLELNARHRELDSLVLHQTDEQISTPLTFRALVGAWRSFPVLRNLALSGLESASLANVTLTALPHGLRALRLERLSGVTDKGLQRLAGLEVMNSVEKLTLIDMNVASIATLANFLSDASRNLTHFTFVQERAPRFSSSIATPQFSSLTCQYIHWEIISQAVPISSHSGVSILDAYDSAPLAFPFTNTEPLACLANSILGTSIARGGFPALRRICVPHDPQGIIQALCTPLATALLPSDIPSPLPTPPPRIVHSEGFDTVLTTAPMSFKQRVGEESPTSPRADSAYDSAASTYSISNCVTTTAHSRLAAEARILAARRTTGARIRVFDPTGKLYAERTIEGSMGTLGSRIEYVLVSDEGYKGRDDEGRWVLSTEDAVAYQEEGDEERMWKRSFGGVEDLF